jgi:hypothetical protein
MVYKGHQTYAHIRSAKGKLYINAKFSSPAIVPVIRDMYAAWRRYLVSDAN